MEKFGYVKSLCGCLLFGIALHVAAFAIGGNALWLLAVCGLPAGLLWPSVIALSVRIYGQNSGVASGVMMTICPIISSACQLINGFMNTVFGIGIGYFSMNMYAIFAAFALIILGKLLKKQNIIV